MCLFRRQVVKELVLSVDVVFESATSFAAVARVGTEAEYLKRHASRDGRAGGGYLALEPDPKLGAPLEVVILSSRARACGAELGVMQRALFGAGAGKFYAPW